jgi:glycerol-3-phosphate cytidylyltransferase
MKEIVGFTCGAFDLLHCGHIVMFEEAKSNCDQLIVGLQTDPSIDRPDTKNKPIQTLFERYMQLQALKSIDKIIPYDTEESLLDLLHTLKIDIRFVGEDYREKEFTGKGLHQVFFTSRKHSFSTSSLRERTYQDYQKEVYKNFEGT